MSVQSEGDSSTHMNITGDRGGNSTGVYTVTRSWKRHSTDGILRVSQGGVFSSGTDMRGVGTRGDSSGELQINRMKVKETLSNTKDQTVLFAGKTFHLFFYLP